MGMDFDDIKFTEWQIDKIRIAINKYRITNVNNGRMVSWSRVRDDITNSDINIDRYFEDDAALAFKQEALRRFAANESVLELDTLKDLTQFLLNKTEEHRVGNNGVSRCKTRWTTADEMLISDWSSDVCSSDLRQNPDIHQQIPDH